MAAADRAAADGLVTILGVDIGKNALSKRESFKNGIYSVNKVTVGLSAVATDAHLLP